MRYGLECWKLNRKKEIKMKVVKMRMLKGGYIV